MIELIEKVKDWGLERNIVYIGEDGQDQQEIMKAQAEYTLKEVSEISDAYADDSFEEFIDGVGDVLVTLIVGASSDNRALEKLSKKVIDFNRGSSFPVSMPFGDLYVNLWESAYSLIHSDNRSHDYTVVLFDLNEILGWINKHFKSKKTLKDCLEHAYNEIKDRKGKVVDGQFIKDVSVQS